MNKEFVKGIFKNNPVFCLVLGLCPALAVSNRVENALTMSMAVVFVLLCSEIMISLAKKWIPREVRIPSYIVIIATFVTIASLVMQAYIPALNRALGIYVPLIVVNCIILGRAEAFASRHSVKDSIYDALGMGIGFTLALTLISLIREILGTMQLQVFGLTMFKLPMEPAIVFILAPGALLIMGLLLALFNFLGNKKVEKTGCCEVKE
jgi:electron transport complex protein RnfE